MNQKKENVILSQFCMGTKLLSDVGVCAAWFWCKIWTKGRWYFLLVALYYCKIFFFTTGDPKSGYCGGVDPDSMHLFRDADSDLPWTGIIFGLSISSIWYWWVTSESHGFELIKAKKDIYYWIKLRLRCKIFCAQGSLLLDKQTYTNNITLAKTWKAY